MIDSSGMQADLVALIRRLQQAGIDWDAENIADSIWLARYLESSPAAPRRRPSSPAARRRPRSVYEDDSELEPSPSSEEEVPLYATASRERDTSTATAPAKGIPFQAPTAPALRRTLALGRALRPLMRKVDSYSQSVLDEDATAEQTAEQQFCMTVIKPAEERWLEVALVIEQSASSFLWDETIRDFKQVLERQGAFRQVSLWYLQTTADGAVALYAKRPTAKQSPQPRSHKELIDASGRRLILVVSDCISVAWRSGVLHRDYLEPWAGHGPLTIVQLLPGHLWQRTVLSAGIEVQLGAWIPGVANERLLFQESPTWTGSDPRRGLKLPVVTLEPTALAQWARMVAGYGESWTPGIWFDEGWRMALQDTPPPPTELTPQQLVKRFTATASDLGKRLAGMAALVPLKLPIIYLLQETMLPESTPLHVAEVFISGLVRRTESVASGSEPGDGASPQGYEFVSRDVRERLMESVDLPTAEAVLNRVSQYIGEKLNRSIYSFTALLLLEQELGATAGTELLQFAQITKQTLRQMGGGYATFVDALEAPVPVPVADLEEFPRFRTMTLKTARLVEEETAAPNFPLIVVEESEVVTIEVVQPGVQASGRLEPFEFEIATLEQQQPSSEWVIRRRRGQGRRWLEPLGDELVLEMVALPSGRFVMGSPETEPERFDWEGPQHEVQVEALMMGRYPVTQAQWHFVAGLPQQERELKPDPSQFKGDNRPVERVSWYDAVEFCARLSTYTGREYRLPTEAEWEYTCRAGTTTPFHVGEMLSSEVANCGSGSYNNGPQCESLGETTPVDHFGIANAFGLSDMHGNVYEWCQDHWHGSYEGAPTDGSAWLTDNESARRVRRGGSWLHLPRSCRSAYRNSYGPRESDNNIGFRVVSVAPRALE